MDGLKVVWRAIPALFLLCPIHFDGQPESTLIVRARREDTRENGREEANEWGVHDYRH